MLSTTTMITFLLTLLQLEIANADYPGVEFPWTQKKGTTTSSNIHTKQQQYVVDCPENGEHDYCGIIEFCDGRNPVDGSRVFGYRLPCVGVEEECDCLGVSPGPLIRLQAGNKYKLTLRNVASSSNIITNIHTHGLHIVGDGDSDDVTRKVSGSDAEREDNDDVTSYNCLDYTWDIPMDHVGGTYWYHAHYHGSTEQQVEGGAYGMLIVEDNLNLNPNLPSWTRNELLLQAVETFDGIIGNGGGASGVQTDNVALNYIFAGFFA